MTEIIVFIVGAVVGILYYWYESKSNKIYRFFNKLTHAKKLQMSAEDRKGFIYGQGFLMRFVAIIIAVVILAIFFKLLSPIPAESLLKIVEIYAAMVFGTLLGTYFASAILFANRKIENIDLNKETFDDAIEKGKDMIGNLADKFDRNDDKKEDEPEVESEGKEEKEAEDKSDEEDKDDGKSARDRLKDKGLL